MDLFSGIGRGLEDLGKRAKDVGQRVNIGAKEASKNTKIKLQIKELEARIQKGFQELGEVYYMEMRSQGHKVESTSAQLLLQLDELHKERQALENLLRYRELNGEEEGERRCTNCQQPLGSNDRFCSYCGQRVFSDLEIIEADIEEEELCPNCQYKLQKGTSFCTRCGSKIEK